MLLLDPIQAFQRLNPALPFRNLALDQPLLRRR
jgi:hypothetical protein